MWRVIRLVAGGGMVVVLGAAALLLWPLLWPPDPDTTVQLVNGRLLGETSGYVGRIDRDAQTVDVSSSLVGWRPVVLVVNDETTIQLQDRRGDIADLVKDVPVRVSYEVVGDRRLAKSIEVVTDDTARAGAVSGAGASKAATTPASTVGPTPTDVPPASAATQVPSGTAAAPPGGTPATAGVADTPPNVTAPPPASPAPAPGSSPPTAPTPPAQPVAPKAPSPAGEKRAEPAAPKASGQAEKDERTSPTAPAVRVEAAPPVPPKAAAPLPEARPAAPPRAPAARQEAEPPAKARVAPPSSPETDSGDGAAAIEWLLKRGR
jgi:hypothetical protein